MGKALQKEIITYRAIMRAQKSMAWHTDHLLSCHEIVCLASNEEKKLPESQ